MDVNSIASEMRRAELRGAASCLACGATGTGLKLCGCCKAVRFCNTECQRKAWGGHKAVCAWAGAAAARSALPGVALRVLETNAIGRAAPVTEEKALPLGPRTTATLFGLADPADPRVAKSLRALQKAAVTGLGCEECALRVGAAPGFANHHASLARQVGEMVRAPYAHEHLRPAPGSWVQLELATPELMAAVDEALLETLRGGYEWAWLTIAAYRERWFPCEPAPGCAVSDPPAEAVGVQLLGRLPLSSERGLFELAEALGAALDEALGADPRASPPLIDVELLADPHSPDDDLDAAAGLDRCSACGSELGDRPRHYCLHCTALECGDSDEDGSDPRRRAQLLCDDCLESHAPPAGHVTLRLNPRLDSKASVRPQLCFGTQNVGLPNPAGWASGSHHPGATCGACGAKGWVGALWRDACRPDGGVRCEACFGELAPTLAAEASAGGASLGAWLRLPCYGGGEHAVFDRASLPLRLHLREVGRLCVGEVPYHAFAGGRAAFELEWSDLGLCEIVPLPPQYQPDVLPIQQTWERWMEAFSAFTPRADAEAPPPAPPPAACPRTLPQLRRAVPISAAPLVYALHDFLSAAECDHFIRLGHCRGCPRGGTPAVPGALGQCEWPPLMANDPIASEVEARVGELVGCPPHAADGGVKLMYTPHADELAGREGPEDARAPLGVHVDTNKAPHRWVTVLVYLNSLPTGCGGETCFPLAAPFEPSSRSLAAAAAQAPPPPRGTREGIEAARALLAAGCHHTRDTVIVKGAGKPVGDPGLLAAAETLERVSEASMRADEGEGGEGGGGVCVAPRRGTACCFYTLEPSAAVDPRSFHFGASLLEAGAGKWTLQFFKQLPVAARASERARRAFIEERHPLAPAEID